MFCLRFGTSLLIKNAHMGDCIATNIVILCNNLPRAAHYMAVFWSLRRRLMVWETYFWVCYHHLFGDISMCKLQRPMTNWQMDRFSLLNTRSVSLSTHVTFANTVCIYSWYILLLFKWVFSFKKLYLTLSLVFHYLPLYLSPMYFNSLQYSP